MRKRFIVVLCTLMCLISGAVLSYAQNDIITAYSAKPEAVHLTLSKGEFNLMKSMMGLDRETKKVLRALHIQSVDMLMMDGCSKEDKESFIKDVTLLQQNGTYTNIAGESGRSDSPEKADFLFRQDGERITEMMFYMDGRENGADNFIVMRFICNALTKEIESIVK